MVILENLCFLLIHISIGLEHVFLCLFLRHKFPAQSLVQNEAIWYNKTENRQHYFVTSTRQAESLSFGGLWTDNLSWGTLSGKAKEKQGWQVVLWDMKESQQFSEKNVENQTNFDLIESELSSMPNQLLPTGSDPEKTCTLYWLVVEGSHFFNTTSNFNQNS